jgi:hypothetical protein
MGYQYFLPSRGKTSPVFKFKGSVSGTTSNFMLKAPTRPKKNQGSFLKKE